MTNPMGCAGHGVPAHSESGEADQLTALAHEARLLEFGFDGAGDAAQCAASELKLALMTAMDADSAAELTDARTAVSSALGRAVSLGLELSAQLTDIEIEGVLGTACMPVLTAVLSARA